MARAAVLTIGDELISGRVIDTNGALIAQTLRGIGLETVYHISCGDSVDEIRRCLQFCLDRVEVVITSGGLGPTEDDVTHEGVAATAGVEARLRAELLEQIRRRFEALGVEMPASNERSARLPEGAEVIANENGTAPGSVTDMNGRLVVTLPGVPRELKPMLTSGVIPLLRQRLDLQGVSRIRVLKTFGFTESRLGEIIAPLEKPDPRLLVGYRPTFPEIHLSLTANAPDAAAADGWIGAFERQVRERISDQIWGADGDEYAAVIGGLLRDRGLRLAAVESCTGGLVSKMITDVAGSSDYFERGFATYTNEAKQQMVGVSADIFDRGGPGAVSERCALEMARGAVEAAGVDVAVSTTGVAGPGGGSEDKPVGTVWIGLATPDGDSARVYRFPGDRRWVRTLSAYVALERLRRWLLGIEDVDTFRGRSTRP